MKDFIEHKPGGDIIREVAKARKIYRGPAQLERDIIELRDAVHEADRILLGLSCEVDDHLRPIWVKEWAIPISSVREMKKEAKSLLRAVRNLRLTIKV